MAIDVAELEIFGGEDAFSERWTNSHGLPEQIPANPAVGINRPFSPAEVLSEISDTGLTNQPAWYRASLAIETAPDKKFRVAAQNGLLRIMALDGVMKSRRIDSVAALLKDPALGLTPQGVAQWLLVDDETRRSLTLILRLEGYQVADEQGVHDTVPNLTPEGILPSVGQKFSPDLRPDQIRSYLEAVRQAVGTDRGVVRLAYTAFRFLGFPHENNQFAEKLIRNNVFDPVSKKGDLDKTEVAPFIEEGEKREKFKDPVSGSFLKDVLATDGVVGLARALNRLPAELFAREWEDLKLLLDMVDDISDIRAAQGKFSGLSLADRHAEIVKAMEPPLAKRKLLQHTIKRLLDPDKIEVTKPVTMGEGEKIRQDFRRIFGDITGTSRRR